MAAEYYAYVHARPASVDAAGIFYVGKGKGKRAYDFNRKSQNPHHARIVAKRGIPAVGKIECSSETIAFDLERGLIKCLRRMGVKLANVTDGGEGASGMTHSDATKRKLSVAITEARKSPALRQRHSDAMKLHYADPAARKVTGDKSREVQNTPEALAKRSLISKRVASKLGTDHYKMMASKVDKVSRAKKMAEVNARQDKINSQRTSLMKTISAPAFKEAHSKKMREVGATEEFRKATSIGTKIAVNAPGVQDKRRAYLLAKFAYLKAHNLPRYHKGATKEVVFAWIDEIGADHG